MENEFPRGQLNPAILSTLLEKDKYGYEIIDEIKQKTGIEIKQPSLYSSLKRMETQKYISSYWQDSDIGGKRHYYCLTGIGKEFLDKNPSDLSSFERTAPSVEKTTEEKFEENLKKTVKDIEEKVKNTIEEENKRVTENNKPLLAQQDNIFSAIREIQPKTESKIEEKVKEEENFKQYDLFANIKEENKQKEDFIRPRNLHSKNSSDPYQLKYLGEDELKNEFERIRNQKLGISAKPEEKTEQEANIWLDRNNYINSKREVCPTEDRKEDLKIHIAKSEELEENRAPKRDDGVFITERLEINDRPQKRMAPAVLNIESNNYPSFLNTKINQENREYQQKNADMYKRPEPKYDYNQSLAKLESKFEKHVNNKFETMQGKNTENNFDESEKIENTYERVKSSNPVFNSYKSLEAYYNSRGIGFYPYNKKEKKENQYVEYSLIKLIRGSVFALYTIILAFAFYFGINHPSIGKIVYIIFPILALGITTIYALSYRKARSNTIIQMEKSDLSPIILPLISACSVLVIIAINLIIGFHDGNALYYFPLLIYPICLALYLSFMVPLNKLIRICVLKLREWLSNRTK